MSFSFKNLMVFKNIFLFNIVVKFKLHVFFKKTQTIVKMTATNGTGATFIMQKYFSYFIRA